MTDLENAPWLNDHLEDAPWATKPKVGVAEDVAKTAAPSLLRGTLQMLTAPGTISDLFDRGVQAGVHYLAPDSKADKFLTDMRGLVTDPKTGKNLVDQNSFFPTYDTVKDKAEKKTGPLYEAKTDVGKGVQTGLEVLPNMATGGPASAIVKSVGAGAGSVLGGKAGEGIAGSLPDWAAPYARPVGEAVGTFAGSLTPSGLRKAVTPLPASPEQASVVNLLKNTHPEITDAATAGQLTGRPWLQKAEGRLMDVGPQQEKAFTQAALGEAGIPGNNFQRIDFGQLNGEELGRLRRAGQINSTEFANLNKVVSQEKANLTRAVDVNHLGTINDIQKDIKLGVGQNPKSPPLNMTGQRYEHLRERVQSAIDSAPSAADKNALSNVRSALDNAFYNSVHPDQAARAKELATQYANYQVLRNIKPDVNRTTVSPKEVLSQVAKNWGNAAANEDRGSLAPLARNTAAVSPPLPPRDTTISPITNTVGTIVSALLAKSLGHAGTEAGVLGHLETPNVVNAFKDIGSHVVTNKEVQSYLKNQKWLPDRYIAPEANPSAAMAQLLMAPPGQRAVNGQ